MMVLVVDKWDLFVDLNDFCTCSTKALFVSRSDRKLYVGMSKFMYPSVSTK